MKELVTMANTLTHSHSGWNQHLIIPYVQTARSLCYTPLTLDTQNGQPETPTPPPPRTPHAREVRLVYKLARTWVLDNLNNQNTNTHKIQLLSNWEKWPNAQLTVYPHSLIIRM